jgi:single-stranded DNA-binding protein
MNIVSLQGFITAPPKISTYLDKDGGMISYCFFRVKDGDLTIRCVASGELAEKIHLNLRGKKGKGAQIFIIGHLVSRKYKSGLLWKTLTELVVTQI